MKTLDLFVPDFFLRLYESAEPSSSSAGLRKLLARGFFEKIAVQGEEGVLWYLLYQELRADPPAALIRGLQKGSVVRADPVSLEVGMSDVVLHPLKGKEALAGEEVEAIAAAVNELIVDQGGYFELDASGAGFMGLDDSSSLESVPTGCLNGMGIRTLLDEGVFDTFWKRLFTELQMILHGLEFNDVRERQGRLIINALWFWGAGEGQMLPSVRPDWVGGNDPLSGALVASAFHGIGDGKGFKDIDKHVVDALVVLSGNDGVCVAGKEPFNELLQLWFWPALEAIRRGELKQLRIVDENGLAIRLNRSRLRAFWRRPKAFNEFIQKNLPC